MPCGSEDADVYDPAMRPVAIVLAVGLTLAVSGASVAVASARVPSAIDECKLLTDAQAATVMQAELFGSGVPDNGGCSWETDPSDRQHLSYVVLKVEKRAKLLARYGDDLRTYLDESTNVGIDPLPGVGNEAFSIYDPLTGPGASSGIEVAVGKRIVSIDYRAAERIENPSPAFDTIVKIVKKVVAKVRKA